MELLDDGFSTGLSKPRNTAAHAFAESYRVWKTAGPDVTYNGNLRDGLKILCDKAFLLPRLLEGEAVREDGYIDVPVLQSHLTKDLKKALRVRSDAGKVLVFLRHYCWQTEQPGGDRILSPRMVPEIARSAWMSEGASTWKSAIAQSEKGPGECSADGIPTRPPPADRTARLYVDMVCKFWSHGCPSGGTFSLYCDELLSSSNKITLHYVGGHVDLPQHVGAAPKSWKVRVDDEARQGMDPLHCFCVPGGTHPKGLHLRVSNEYIQAQMQYLFNQLPGARESAGRALRDSLMKPALHDQAAKEAGNWTGVFTKGTATEAKKALDGAENYKLSSDDKSSIPLHAAASRRLDIEFRNAFLRPGDKPHPNLLAEKEGKVVYGNLLKVLMTNYTLVVCGSEGAMRAAYEMTRQCNTGCHCDITMGISDVLKEPWSPDGTGVHTIMITMPNPLVDGSAPLTFSVAFSTRAHQEAVFELLNGLRVVYNQVTGGDLGRDIAYFTADGALALPNAAARCFHGMSLSEYLQWCLTSLLHGFRLERPVLLLDNAHFSHCTWKWLDSQQMPATCKWLAFRVLKYVRDSNDLYGVVSVLAATLTILGELRQLKLDGKEVAVPVSNQVPAMLREYLARAHVAQPPPALSVAAMATAPAATTATGDSPAVTDEQPPVRPDTGGLSMGGLDFSDLLLRDDVSDADGAGVSLQEVEAQAVASVALDGGEAEDTPALGEVLCTVHFSTCSLDARLVVRASLRQPDKVYQTLFLDKDTYVYTKIPRASLVQEDGVLVLPLEQTWHQPRVCNYLAKKLPMLTMFSNVNHVRNENPHAVSGANVESTINITKHMGFLEKKNLPFQKALSMAVGNERIVEQGTDRYGWVASDTQRFVEESSTRNARSRTASAQQWLVTTGSAQPVPAADEEAYPEPHWNRHGVNASQQELASGLHQVIKQMGYNVEEQEAAWLGQEPGQPGQSALGALLVERYGLDKSLMLFKQIKAAGVRKIAALSAPAPSLTQQLPSFGSEIAEAFQLFERAASQILDSASRSTSFSLTPAFVQELLTPDAVVAKAKALDAVDKAHPLQSRLDRVDGLERGLHQQLVQEELGNVKATSAERCGIFDCNNTGNTGCKNPLKIQSQWSKMCKGCCIANGGCAQLGGLSSHRVCADGESALGGEKVGRKRKDPGTNTDTGNAGHLHVPMPPSYLTSAVPLQQFGMQLPHQGVIQYQDVTRLTTGGPMSVGTGFIAHTPYMTYTTAQGLVHQQQQQQHPYYVGSSMPAGFAATLGGGGMYWLPQVESEHQFAPYP